MVQKGKIIVIEGTDCSGKETQSTMLVDRLNSERISTKRMDFPQYSTPTGRIIAGPYLGKPSVGETWFEGGPTRVDPKIASLYYAADRRAALPKIQETLEQGTHLILDRYVSANMGHQGGKIRSPVQRDEFWNFLHSLEYNLLGLPQPDKTIFLYMPSEVAVHLREKRNEAADGHEADLQHLQDAEEAYLELATKYDWNLVNCAPDRTMDTLRKPVRIHEEVYGLISKLL